MSLVSIVVPALDCVDLTIRCFEHITRNAGVKYEVIYVDDGSTTQTLDRIYEWTAAFDYQDLDRVIADMQACGAFKRSRAQHRLRFPSRPAG